MNQRRLAAGLAALAVAASAAGCGTIDPDEAMESIQVFAMDTVIICSIYGENSVSAAFDIEEEVYRLEDLFTRTREDSALSAVNASAGAPVEVGAELWTLLQDARTYSDLTGGAFDITLAPVSSAWGFTEESYRVPSQQELEELLSGTGMEHLHLTANTSGEGGTVTLDPGTQIDLGGIAKGYVSDAAAAIFRDMDVPRGTVSLGGNVYVRGTRPDGEPWMVGIQDPAQPETSNACIGVLSLSDAFAVTSGSYQRYFEQDGKIYHHILDPQTGMPAQSGLVSVTVVTQEGEGTGTMCDALSTALFVMGEEQALDFWRQQGESLHFELVLVTEDDRVLVTDGLESAFTPQEGSGYTFETVS